MMEVKLLSKVVNSAKAVAKDYTTYYKTANSALKKFNKEHPVVSAVGTIATFVAGAYLSNPDFWNDTIESIKDKVSGEHEENNTKDTYKDTYEEYISALSAEHLAKELDVIDRICSLQNIKLSKTDNEVQQSVIESCISRNVDKRYDLTTYVKKYRDDIEFKETDYMKLYETVHLYRLIDDYVNTSIDIYINSIFLDYHLMNLRKN